MHLTQSKVLAYQMTLYRTPTIQRTHAQEEKERKGRERKKRDTQGEKEKADQRREKERDNKEKERVREKREIGEEAQGVGRLARTAPTARLC